MWHENEGETDGASTSWPHFIYTSNVDIERKKNLITYIFQYKYIVYTIQFKIFPKKRGQR